LGVALVYEKTFRDRGSGFVKFMENKLNFFFRHQIWHVGGTIALFYIGYQFVDLDSNTNTFLRISALSWFMIAMAIPLVHQIYTWICWRSELCWKSVSSSIGLKGYLIGFFILIISRFSAVVLCFVDYGSLYKPGLISWALSIVVFIPGLYTMYSVKKYFGFVRAAGADHLIQNIEICLLKKEEFLNGLLMPCILMDLLFHLVLQLQQDHNQCL